MPIGNDEVKSLRSLSADATIDQIFNRDKSLLPKCYRLGILPVRVIDEIYCHWARRAISEAEAALASPFINYTGTSEALEEAKADLGNAKQLAFGYGWWIVPEDLNGELVAIYQKKIDEKRLAHEATSTAYSKVLSEEIKKFEEILGIFTHEEYRAITCAVPEGQLEEMSSDLTKMLLSMNYLMSKADQADQADQAGQASQADQSKEE